MTDSELSANGEFVQFTVDETLKYLTSSSKATRKTKSTKYKTVARKSAEDLKKLLDTTIEDLDCNLTYTIKSVGTIATEVFIDTCADFDVPEQLIYIFEELVTKFDKSIKINYKGWFEDGEE